ncbi:MAG: hypothetical protein JSS00_09165 [Proteobacteria bacterium]|nr:hypothetical protein [Pseudomonadota bacterium]
MNEPPWKFPVVVLGLGIALVEPLAISLWFGRTHDQIIAIEASLAIGGVTMIVWSFWTLLRGRRA